MQHKLSATTELGSLATLADAQGGALQLLVDGSGPEEAAKLPGVARAAASAKQ